MKDMIKPTFFSVAAANEAIERLCGELRQAKRPFETGRNGGREGVISAVNSVFQFLHLLPSIDDEKLHAPLGALLNALKSLDKGKVLPLLEHAKATNRPPDSEFRNDMKGAAVWTVDRLRTTGLRSPAARAAVADVLHSEKVLANGRPVTSHTVRNWCQEVSNDLGYYSDAGRTFNELNEKMSATSVRDPNTLRRAYLDMFRDQIRRTRGRDS